VGSRADLRVLSEHGCPIAPSTYYDALARSRRPSARDARDEVLKVQITRVHRDNYGIYGARKVRWTVERRMGDLGIADVLVVIGSAPWFRRRNGSGG
jgi:putative transposase